MLNVVTALTRIFKIYDKVVKKADPETFDYDAMDKDMVDDEVAAVHGDQIIIAPRTLWLLR